MRHLVPLLLLVPLLGACGAPYAETDHVDLTLRGDVAWVCAAAGDPIVIQATVAEVDRIERTCAAASDSVADGPDAEDPESEEPAEAVVLAGTVTGTGEGRTTTVHVGRETGTVEPDGSYAVAGLAPGRHDVVLVETERVPPTSRAVRIGILRDVTIGGDAQLDLDLDRDAAVASVAGWTLDGVRAADLSAAYGVDLVTDGGTRARVAGGAVLPTLASGTVALEVPHVPGLLDAGEAYAAWATAIGPATARLLATRVPAAEAADATALRFLQPLEPTVDVAAEAPYPRYRARWVDGVDAGTFVLSFFDPGADAYRGWGVFLTRGWLGGSADYALPDLAYVGGWDDAWALDAPEVRWSVQAHAVPLAEILDGGSSGDVRTTEADGALAR